MLCCSPCLSSLQIDRAVSHGLPRPTTWQPDANPNGFLLTAAEVIRLPLTALTVDTLMFVIFVVQHAFLISFVTI